MQEQRHYVCTGVVGYWVLSVLGCVGVCLVVLLLLPLFKPGVMIDVCLFVFMAIYLGLLNQHFIFCNYIVCMNEIPYMWGYILAAVFGTGLVCLFCGVFGMGAYGIIMGQAISQLVYNNWKWPAYLCNKIGFSYRECFREGLSEWKATLLGGKK